MYGKKLERLNNLKVRFHTSQLEPPPETSFEKKWGLVSDCYHKNGGVDKTVVCLEKGVSLIFIITNGGILHIVIPFSFITELKKKENYAFLFDLKSLNICFLSFARQMYLVTYLFQISYELDKQIFKAQGLLGFKKL